MNNRQLPPAPPIGPHGIPSNRVPRAYRQAPELRIDTNVSASHPSHSRPLYHASHQTHGIVNESGSSLVHVSHQTRRSPQVLGHATYNPADYGVFDANGNNNYHRSQYYYNNNEYLPGSYNSPTYFGRLPSTLSSPFIPSGHPSPTTVRSQAFVAERQNNDVNSSSFGNNNINEGVTLSTRAIPPPPPRPRQVIPRAQRNSSFSFDSNIVDEIVLNNQSNRRNSALFSPPLPYSQRRFSGIPLAETTYSTEEMPRSEVPERRSSQIVSDNNDRPQWSDVGEIREIDEEEGAATALTTVDEESEEQRAEDTRDGASSIYSQVVWEGPARVGKLNEAMETFAGLGESTGSTPWNRAADAHTGRSLANDWLALQPDERLQRMGPIVKGMWALQGRCRADPFTPAVFLNQDWQDLHDMAVCEPIIYRELSMLVRPRAVIHCGLYNKPPASDDRMNVIELTYGEKSYNYMYSMYPISPFDRLLTKELRIYIPSALGFFSTPGSARFLFNASSRVVNAAIKEFHNQQAARLAELPKLVEWAHQTFYNLKTVTFCGTIGRQRTWDPLALRGRHDKKYIHPGNRLPKLSIIPKSNQPKLDSSNAATTDSSRKSKFRRFTRTTSRLFQLRKAPTAVIDTQATPREAPIVVRRRNRVVVSNTPKFGAWRTFLAHSSVIKTMNYIKEQDKFNMIIFERGFFSRHETVVERDARAARANISGFDNASGPASNITKTLAINPHGFIEKHAKDRIVRYNTAGAKITIFNGFNNLPETREERSTALEKFLVRYAGDKWGSIDDGTNGRQSYLHFCLFDNDTHARLEL